MPPVPGPAPRTVYTVGELAELLRALVEDSLPSLWVEGELSNFARPSSGHWYFTLKDARAQMRCAMFRNMNHLVRPVPANGDLVRIRGRAGVYPARGELQLIVDHLEPAGSGALLRAFEQLKARLEAEGLFAAADKRPLPACPRRIGIVTSATGAALHDVRSALERRWPLAEALLWPVPVQGEAAAPAIVRALAGLPARAPVDVILLVRGGGSIEDLWAFNDEAVARAIRACAVPVVCGVGHEIDFTIADFAADLRAPTPTAAAELATPDIAEWRQRHGELCRQLLRDMERTLVQCRLQLQRSDERLRVQHPGRRLRDRAQRLDELELRLARCADARLGRARERLLALQRRLDARELRRRIDAGRAQASGLRQRLLSAQRRRLDEQQARLQRCAGLLASLDPQRVLGRGYAIVQDEHGRIIDDAATVARGDSLDIRVARGRLRATRSD